MLTPENTSKETHLSNYIEALHFGAVGFAQIEVRGMCSVVSLEHNVEKRSGSMFYMCVFGCWCFSPLTTEQLQTGRDTDSSCGPVASITSLASSWELATQAHTLTHATAQISGQELCTQCSTHVL